MVVQPTPMNPEVNELVRLKDERILALVEENRKLDILALRHECQTVDVLIANHELKASAAATKVELDLANSRLASMEASNEINDRENKDGMQLIEASEQTLTWKLGLSRRQNAILMVDLSQVKKENDQIKESSQALKLHLDDERKNGAGVRKELAESMQAFADTESGKLALMQKASNQTLTQELDFERKRYATLESQTKQALDESALASEDRLAEAKKAGDKRTAALEKQLKSKSAAAKKASDSIIAALHASDATLQAELANANKTLSDMENDEYPPMRYKCVLCQTMKVLETGNTVTIQPCGHCVCRACVDEFIWYHRSRFAEVIPCPSCRRESTGITALYFP